MYSSVYIVDDNGWRISQYSNNSHTFFLGNWRGRAPYTENFIKTKTGSNYRQKNKARTKMITKEDEGHLGNPKRNKESKEGKDY